MPRVSARRISKRKAPYQKRRSAPKRRSVVRVSRNFLSAPSARVKMKYAETVTINPASGLIGTYSFRANGLFDPNLSGTGHQPLGFDQMQYFYNHYVVVGSKMTAKFVNTNYTANTGDITLCGIHVSDDGSLPFADLDTMLEQLGSNTSWTYGASPETSNIPLVKKSFNPKTYFNVSDMKDNSQLGAAVNADPSEIAAFTLFLGPLDPAADVPTHKIIVMIEYDVLFTERKETLGS